MYKGGKEMQEEAKDGKRDRGEKGGGCRDG